MTLLIHSSKRASDSTKTLSLLGAIFLPATYLASVFSMTLFNFQNGKSLTHFYFYFQSSPFPDLHLPLVGQPSVAPQVWIHFAITIPLTTIIAMRTL